MTAFWATLGSVALIVAVFTLVVSFDVTWIGDTPSPGC
jgi:hypothetical protein